jgi:hypothetical protein
LSIINNKYLLLDKRKVKTRLHKSFLFTKPIYSNRAITNLLLNSNRYNNNNDNKKLFNNKKIINSFSEKILYKKNKSIDNKNSRNKYNLDFISNSSKQLNSIKNENSKKKENNLNNTEKRITINNNIIINYNNINNNNENNNASNAIKNKNSNSNINKKSIDINNNNLFNIKKEKNNNNEEEKKTDSNNQTPKIIKNKEISFNSKGKNLKNNTNSFFKYYYNSPNNRTNHTHKNYNNKNNKNRLSILDNNSNFSIDTNSKIYKKIEINPYNNFNTIKKYFIFRLKKLYVLKKKNKNIENSPLSYIIENNNNIWNTNNKENFNRFKKKNSISSIFPISSNQKIISKEAEKLLTLENGNIQINEYLIYKDKLLGIGHYSKVYLAENIKTKKLFAIKIKNSKRIQDKIEIVKRIHCKYIVEVYEILQTNKDSYIVLELMENNSLFNIIDDLDIFCIWKYFRNLVSAIEHCHEIAKIVNLNINLKDCLISLDDILKLSNFSQSKILGDDGTIILNEKEFLENFNKEISYPPEIDFNECDDCDSKNNENIILDGKAVDIWLLGNLLFTLIFGESFVNNNVHNSYVNNNNFNFSETTEKNNNENSVNNENNNQMKLKLNNDIFNSHITFKPKTYDLNKIDSEDKQLDQLIKGMLAYNPQERYTIEDIKKDNWTTKDGEFPMPDIEEEALEYIYKLTSEEVIKANEK